ncbi:hypothetical protein C8P64_2114 [Christiangramia gaetbulicola]|uniref:Uncharacterized protein n=1 Tax=Christiangramia gaetbulicola TaxID=703340 RepID=A0A2T6AID9_9FLAO|nr:hypothetical protein C8P64_2114 [Christiangramia gaetbulicola]
MHRTSSNRGFSVELGRKNWSNQQTNNKIKEFEYLCKHLHTWETNFINSL